MMQGEAQRRSVTYVPYDPSLKRLRGWGGAFSSLESRGSFVLRSVPRVAGAPTTLIHLTRDPEAGHASDAL
jgi:hypothetical protein